MPSPAPLATRRGLEPGAGGDRLAQKRGARGQERAAGGGSRAEPCGSRTHRRQPGAAETLVVRRYRDRDQAQVVQVDDSLSTAAPEMPRGACARVAKYAASVK